MTGDGFSFLVLGKPIGKGRPRFANGRTYTDERTTSAEDTIYNAWKANGVTRLEGAIHLDVQLGVERPKSHYTSKGELSANGRRHPFPDNKKPDVDNALKLVMDALNTRAWKDDVQVVDARVERVWAQRAYTRVIARQLSQDMEVAA